MPLVKISGRVSLSGSNRKAYPFNTLYIFELVNRGNLSLYDNVAVNICTAKKDYILGELPAICFGWDFKIGFHFTQAQHFFFGSSSGLYVVPLHDIRFASHSSHPTRVVVVFYVKTCILDHGVREEVVVRGINE
ncbi:hypothetical protein Dimus_021857 [Dionaea muscipula]